MRQKNATRLMLAMLLLVSASAHAQWRVTKSKNRVTERETAVATVRSKPVGGLVAILGVQVHSDQDGDPPAVWLEVPGQIVRCHGNCEVAWRVDSAPHRGIHAVLVGDGSRSSVFLGGEWYVLEDLRDSRRLLVEVPIYRRGEVVFEFNVSNFKLPDVPQRTPPRARLPVVDYVPQTGVRGGS